ncbi:NAD(P)-binding domain [Ostreococcus tauri]|uniref:NAD(P)-binding domain n=1 Tax=Ostreococcus tauri TaxID=70448 RepID=A0A090N4E2_OSTTA|nr:NAD(P)-binding domain [Ostreococcus tauri]CEF99713.1 NAD(P)-binding domain [Ostreococcus tauri]|eukprot:XP_003082099.2 NAD(P)-binding domain [Ostreococcus tauri]
MATTSAARARVGVDGRARRVRVRARGGFAASARAWGRTSMDGWRGRRERGRATSATVEPGDRVVVFGASGGVGQIVVAMLEGAGYDAVGISRRRSAGTPRGGERTRGTDCRDYAAVSNALDERVRGVVCCLGTTAFPSARWRDADGKFTNGPEATDYVSVSNVVEAAKEKCPNLKRFVLVSSVGVLRTNVMPFIILNAFGVLKWKREGEKTLEASGLPYTILRPGRLTDGPYTSYDLNTLLKATSGTKRNVQIGTGDVLLPEATSRIVVAQAARAALESDAALGRAFELGSTEGEGPGSDLDKWTALFESAS